MNCTNFFNIKSSKISKFIDNKNKPQSTHNSDNLYKNSQSSINNFKKKEDLKSNFKLNYSSLKISKNIQSMNITPDKKLNKKKSDNRKIPNNKIINLFSKKNDKTKLLNHFKMQNLTRKKCFNEDLIFPKLELTPQVTFLRKKTASANFINQKLKSSNEKKNLKKVKTIEKNHFLMNNLNLGSNNNIFSTPKKKKQKQNKLCKNLNKTTYKLPKLLTLANSITNNSKSNLFNLTSLDIFKNVKENQILKKSELNKFSLTKNSFKRKFSNKVSESSFENMPSSIMNPNVISYTSSQKRESKNDNYSFVNSSYKKSIFVSNPIFNLMSKTKEKVSKNHRNCFTPAYNNFKIKHRKFGLTPVVNKKSNALELDNEILFTDKLELKTKNIYQTPE